nr:uroporphyrinogen-III synthase [Campylobacter sp.]
MKQIYLCSNTKFDDPDIINLNLLQIKFNKFSLNLNKFDALIVTSKNSINSLKFNQISPFNIEIFAIGEATKNACLDFGFSNISTPNSSHGNEFIKEILPQLKSKNILFLRAKETSSNISEILHENG